MGLIIPNNINIRFLNVVSTSTNYKLLYELPHIRVSGLVLKLTNFSINDCSNSYKIIIKDKTSIELLKNIEMFLLNKVPNYKHALKYNNSEYYITIRKNSNTTSIINKYHNKTEIYINLLKVVKFAFHSYLIIYVI